jgi:hypothetical protein
MIPQIINRLDDIILGGIKERENSGYEEKNGFSNDSRAAVNEHVDVGVSHSTSWSNWNSLHTG